GRREGIGVGVGAGDVAIGGVAALRRGGVGRVAAVADIAARAGAAIARAARAAQAGASTRTRAGRGLVAARVGVVATGLGDGDVGQRRARRAQARPQPHDIPGAAGAARGADIAGGGAAAGGAAAIAIAARGGVGGVGGLVRGQRVVVALVVGV